MKNTHETEKHFKKFMQEMLKLEGADLRYIRGILNSDIRTNEGESYLKLICHNKEKLNICTHLMQSVSYASQHFLRQKTRSYYTVNEYIQRHPRDIIKLDKSNVLLARISDPETMTYDDIELFSFVKLSDYNNPPKPFNQRFNK